MQGKEHTLPVCCGWYPGGSNVTGRNQKLRQRDEQEPAKSASVMRRGLRRGSRWDSDHFEDVQQLLTPGGNISMTADKVKHFARRKRMEGRLVWRDSTPMVRAAVKAENEEVPL